MHPHAIWTLTVLLALGAFVERVDASPVARVAVAGPVLLIAEEAPAKNSDDATNSEKPQDRVYLGNEPVESCMKRWDPGTHMTKEAWRESCERIREERSPYLKDR